MPTGDVGPTALTVDLNADVGELADGAGLPLPDRSLLGLVTTAHVACGFHAGHPELMRRTVEAALAAGVVVGAHPSYPDRSGFGRRPMDRSPSQVADDVVYQVGALQAVARTCGGRVRSVKAHGALYNRMAIDEACTLAVAGAVAALGDDLVLVVPAGSPAEAAARRLGVPTAAEGFCDRGYLPDGTLAPRSTAGALVADPEEAGRRAVAMAVGGRVTAVDGIELPLRCDTLCIHGDAPGAVAMADAVRRALRDAGVGLAPFTG